MSSTSYPLTEFRVISKAQFTPGEYEHSLKYLLASSWVHIKRSMFPDDAETVTLECALSFRLAIEERSGRGGSYSASKFTGWAKKTESGTYAIVVTAEYVADHEFLYFRAKPSAPKRSRTRWSSDDVHRITIQ